MKQFLVCLAITFMLSSCKDESTKKMAPLNDVAKSTLYHGGSILTMTGNSPTYVEALVEQDGVIVFTGSKSDAEKEYAAAANLIDLEGKTMLPGFMDAHSHYINSLLVANQCQLYAPPSGPGRDIESIIATLRTFVTERNIQKGDMIMGYGYDDTVMPDGKLLNRDILDEAFPDNPVRVEHVSMHGCVLNSLAMKKYGISSDTETPPGGVIVRKPGTTEPYGLIMETAFLPIMEQSDPMTPEQEIELSKAGQMLYAEAGITTAHEGASHLPQIETIKRASEAGANIIDVVAYPFITDVDKILELVPRDNWLTYKDNFKIGGVKITIDGSPQGRTAYFSTPYLDGGPAGEENWTGEMTFPQAIANEMVKKVYGMNVPLILHCNGDGAIDAFLESYEYARDGDYSKPWNVTSIHSQFMRKDQMPKFVEYGIRPSFYTLHTYYFYEAHLKNRGFKQAQYISPMRDAMDMGMRPTNHTDFVVAPLDQMFMLYSAVNRISRAGAEVGLDQSVTPFEGLKSMTIYVAEQYDEQSSKGTLEKGKRADLVILDKNPLEVEPSAIKDIKIVQTIKDGVSVYNK
jgi:hypothetical protein